MVDCRKLLGIPDDVEFDVVFHCKEPFTGKGNVFVIYMNAQQLAWIITYFKTGMEKYNIPETTSDRH